MMQNNILTEEQGGFGATRGCQDNLFILSATIVNNVHKRSSYLYAFKGAFDLISHTKL